MDLRLFHPCEFPNRKFKMLDRLNSWTRLQPCRFLEWTAWYDSSVPQRLLGHYRLFQLYKKHHSGGSLDIPVVNGYILQRQITFGLKYKFFKFAVHFAKIVGYPERTMEIYIINKMLLHECSHVLHEFLTNADTDFEKAYKKAIQQIHAPQFLNPASAVTAQPPKIIVQGKAPIHGKEKGVLTKKQVLILFDLLSQSANMESIELDKPNKLDTYAEFLRAVTGKSIDTWLEELRHYRNKDLYHFDTIGERNQLISTLTNLSEILRKTGFRTLYKLVNEKMRAIETKNQTLS